MGPHPVRFPNPLPACASWRESTRQQRAAVSSSTMSVTGTGRRKALCPPFGAIPCQLHRWAAISYAEEQGTPLEKRHNRPHAAKRR